MEEGDDGEERRGLEAWAWQLGMGLRVGRLEAWT